MLVSPCFRIKCFPFHKNGLPFLKQKTLPFVSIQKSFPKGIGVGLLTLSGVATTTGTVGSHLLSVERRGSVVATSVCNGIISYRADTIETKRQVRVRSNATTPTTCGLAYFNRITLTTNPS